MQKSLTKSWKQTAYQYKGGNAIPNIAPVQGELCDVKNILKRNAAKNMNFVSDKILNYWESFEAFNDKAYGYCLLVDNIVASLAITGWKAENVYAISVETENAFRRRGYAKICASSLLNCCLQNGYVNNYMVYGFKVN